MWLSIIKTNKPEEEDELVWSPVSDFVSVTVSDIEVADDSDSDVWPLLWLKGWKRKPWASRCKIEKKAFIKKDSTLHIYSNKCIKNEQGLTASFLFENFFSFLKPPYCLLYQDTIEI